MSTRVKGKTEHKKWEKGNNLSVEEAVLAMCYVCNGFDDSNVDCGASRTCPMYQFSPYKGVIEPL